MWLGKQTKIIIEEDGTIANVLTFENDDTSCHVANGENNEACQSNHGSDYKNDGYSAAVTFTDEDLILGSQSHNLPLFVTTYTL